MYRLFAHAFLAFEPYVCFSNLLEISARLVSAVFVIARDTHHLASHFSVSSTTVFKYFFSFVSRVPP